MSRICFKTWKSRLQDCVKVEIQTTFDRFGNHGNCDKNLEFGGTLSKISGNVVKSGQNCLKFQSLKQPRKSGILTSSIGGGHFLFERAHYDPCY